MENLIDILNENKELFDGTTIFENPSFYEAVLGHTDNGRIIYSYDKMIECLTKTPYNMDEEEAIEWIDCNTIRTIPYMGNKSPIICYTTC